MTETKNQKIQILKDEKLTSKYLEFVFCKDTLYH